MHRTKLTARVLFLVFFCSLFHQICFYASWKRFSIAIRHKKGERRNEMNCNLHLKIWFWENASASLVLLHLFAQLEFLKLFCIFASGIKLNVAKAQKLLLYILKRRLISDKNFIKKVKQKTWEKINERLFRKTAIRKTLIRKLDQSLTHRSCRVLFRGV